MTFYEIPKAEGPCRATGMEWVFLQDALRHRQNAARHLAEGRPAYAEGSLRKAERWEKKAADLRRLLTCTW